MRDRATGLRHQLDVVVGDPDRVSHRYPLVERTEPVEILDEASPVELTGSDELHLRLEHVDVIRGVVALRELRGGDEQVLRAALGARGRDDVAETPCAAVEAAYGLLRELEVALGRRRVDRVKLAPQLVGEDLVRVGQRVEVGLVDHVAGDIRADAELVVGVEDRLELRQALRRQLGDVVEEAGHAALQRFDPEEQRAEVDEARRERERPVERNAVEHEHLERHARKAAAGEVLARVCVRVDEPGNHETVSSVDHLGARSLEAFPDRGDAVTVDQHVAGERLQPVCGVRGEDVRAFDQNRHLHPPSG